MEIETPSSDELIKRAKESLLFAAEEESALVESPEAVDVASKSLTATDAVITQRPVQSRRKPAPAARRRADPFTEEQRPRRTAQPSAPVPPSVPVTGSRSGRFLRFAGTFILVMMALFWISLLIGIIDDPGAIGEILGGGVVLSVIPVIVGMSLRRAGSRRAKRT